MTKNVVSINSRVELTETPEVDDRNDATTNERTTSTNVFFDINQIQEQQNNDTKVQSIKENLQSKTNSSFMLEDGILYKCSNDSQRETTRRMFYVPSSMIEALIHSYYDD